MTLEQVRRLKRLIIKRANGDEEDMSGPAPSESSVLKFIKKNPRPKDKQFHEWAEGKGVNVHKAESTAYGILSDLLTKGRSKGKHPAGVADKDVSKGVDIEAEHTPNREIQRKITDDHNTELKKYYDPKKGLPAMEKKLEKDGGLGRAAGRAAHRKKEQKSVGDLMSFLRSKGHRVSTSAPVKPEKRGTIVKPTGALRSNLGSMPKVALFSFPSRKFKELTPRGKRVIKAAHPKHSWHGESDVDELDMGSAVMNHEERTGKRFPDKKIGHLWKSASFMYGLMDELEKLGYNGGTTTATIRPGSTESKALRKALKAKGVWEGKSPGLLQRAAHGIRRLGRPSPTAHLKATKKPTSEKEQAKDISRALGGSLSSMPSLPKVAFLHGFVDELEKLGVSFAKTPGKSMKVSATLRRLRRFVSGAPKPQLKRMRFKQQAREVAHAVSGATKDLRGAKRGGKMMLGAGTAMLKREARPSIRAARRVAGLGPALTGFFKRNPEVLPMVALPSAIIAGSVGVTALARLLTKKKKKKKGMKKTAGPPTLAKLRRAYPKGKVKPPVADPGAPAKVAPEFPKAADIVGGVMNSMTRAFFVGLTDELEKAGKCATPGEKIRSKGAGKGLAIGKGKGPIGIPKQAMSIQEKIRAAKIDPSTKANPKDTGPKGSGLQDPRAQAMKGRGFNKKAWGSGKAQAEELSAHITRAGGVRAGVKSYNEAKKKKAPKATEKKAGVISNKLYEKMTGKKKKKLFGKGGLVVDTDKKKSEKPMKKKAEESFFAGFDGALGKDAATAVPGPRGTTERRNVAGMLQSLRGIPRRPKAASSLREALKRKIKK